jgi:hypothetical protein
VGAIPILVSIDGPAAAGKSTVVARAASRFGWVPIAEAFDRIDPVPSLRFSSARELGRLERDLLEEDGRRWRAARSLRARGFTVVADTGFLGPVTYTAGLVALGLAPRSTLDAIVARGRTMARHARWGVPDAVVYLALDRGVRRARARRERRSRPPDLERRHGVVGAWEERFYRGPLADVLRGRLFVVPAAGPVDAVARTVGRRVRSVRPLARPSLTALRALELLRPGTPTAPTGSARSAATVKKPTRPDRPPRP